MVSCFFNGGHVSHWIHYGPLGVTGADDLMWDYCLIWDCEGDEPALVEGPARRGLRSHRAARRRRVAGWIDLPNDALGRDGEDDDAAAGWRRRFDQKTLAIDEGCVVAWNASGAVWLA